MCCSAKDAGGAQLFLLHPEREDAGRDLHVRQNIQSPQRPSMKQVTCVPGESSNGERGRRDPAVTNCARSDRYSRMSPGWQSSASQILSRVSKRTPLTLPDFSSETFCSVMPIRSASSFERILRRASITSRLTTIGTMVLR